jgi:SAM-dependent methyltransferase
MTQAARPCLSVIIPCYNEVATVERVVGAVLASPFTAEVVVVDDGSTDGTRELLSTITDARVRVILHERNQGKGAALRTGFGHATADYVIVQDADLEYDPADFAHVLAPLLDGKADVVYGSRFTSSGQRRVLYFWHAVGNRLLTLASNMMTNLNLTDMETCYKAFRREVIQSIEIEEDRFGFEPEITAKLAAGHYRIYEVGISYDGRTYAEGKKIGWRDGVRAGYCIARYSPTGRALAARRASQTIPVAFDHADEELAGSLDSLDALERYRDWILSVIEPALRAPILEIGAGHGTFTRALAARGQVVACEPSGRAFALLAGELASDERVTLVKGDIDDAVEHGPFGSAVAINVLEHIPDDLGALRATFGALVPGGTLALYVPAHMALYSDFDRSIGHQRRYDRRGLTELVQGAGFTVDSCRYMNAAGALAWLVSARVLKQRPTDPARAKLYDRVAVPLIRPLEQRWSPPLGQSLVLLATKPA